MKNKKGISLLVLTITILIMIMLASVVIFTAADTTNNSKKAAFASDLAQIEDMVKEYYLANGVLPIITDTIYTKTTFTNLITAGKNSLESEISDNGDDSAAFYKIDLSKLDIESTERGLEENGDITDAYFVASGTFNVYYLKGRKIADEYYFSLSEKLTDKTKLSNSQTLDTSNITISSATGAIKLTKSTAEFTNSLTVDVKVNLESGETMKYMIAGQEITVAANTTTIDIANIVSNNNTLRTAFYQSEENKYLVAQKYSGSNLIAEAKVSIANLDVLSGSTSSVNISYSKYDKFMLAKISGYTDSGGSGVKEVRVLYTMKKSGEAYYTNLPTDITKDYVKQVGKSFNATTLKLPEDVKNYAAVFIDNAGNISEVMTFKVIEYLANTEKALAEGLVVGDTVTGYSLDTTKSSTATSGEETSEKQAQPVYQTAYSTWKFIGVSDDGEIMIAPEMVNVTDNEKIKLSGKNGYINGPEELDEICRKLYSTDKGTARSMNIDDINNILGYTGDKGSYMSATSGIQITKEAMTIGDIISKRGEPALRYRTTPNGKDDIEKYKAEYYSISETDDVNVSHAQHSTFVFSSTPYWLASRFCDCYFNHGYVYFRVGCVYANGIVSSTNMFCSDEFSYTSETLALRPVVSLAASVNLTKQANDVWNIS